MNDNMNDNMNGRQNSEAEKSLEAQIADLKEQHLRDRADMENLRKRLGREMEKARLFAIENFARDLLPILDNMRRALATLAAQEDLRAGESEASLQDGVRLILRETEAVLARHHVERIEAEGQMFDPNQHEALFEVLDAARPPGTVAQIIEEGYMIGARLLRPARVGVAAAGPLDTEEKDQKTEENEQKET